jgi:hypothetical protein
MITLEQYVGPHASSPDWTPQRQANARRLLDACINLESLASANGITFPINPATGSGVSGQTFGGFRPQNCTQGAAHSSHKEGLAVDRYDPHGDIDAWCMENLDLLEGAGIYIEHPDSTPHWSHWTIKAPNSGRRVFYP